jgi:hypothetical protein
MPENIVVTLKTENQGGFWPFVRGTFAWIGFGGVVVAGLTIFDGASPLKEWKPVIEAMAAFRAGQAAYLAKTNPYGEAPGQSLQKKESTHVD